MSLREKINEQFNAALKSKNKTLISTLRLVLAAIKERDIANRSGKKQEIVKDDEIIKVLKKMRKQRQDRPTQPVQTLADRKEAACKPSRKDDPERRRRHATSAVGLPEGATTTGRSDQCNRCSSWYKQWVHQTAEAAPLGD